jgi:hypothetical protein
MGSAGFRTAQGRHDAYSGIIVGEVRYILKVNAHRADMPEQKCSGLFGLKSVNELTKEYLAGKKKLVEECCNVVDGYELYEISAMPANEKLEPFLKLKKKKMTSVSKV